jgi:hypothetical protein
MKKSMQNLINRKSVIFITFIFLMMLIFIFIIISITRKPEPEPETKIQGQGKEVQKNAFDSLSQPIDVGNKSPSREIIDLLPAPVK